MRQKYLIKLGALDLIFSSTDDPSNSDRLSFIYDISLFVFYLQKQLVQFIVFIISNTKCIFVEPACSELELSRHLLRFSVCACVPASTRASGFVQTISCSCFYGIQNNLVNLFIIKGQCVAGRTHVRRLKVKVILDRCVIYFVRSISLFAWKNFKIIWYTYSP